MNQSIHIIPLGGIGNVTKNMYVYEYQDELLIIDCGIGFPDPSMLGVDILIPDIRYLQGKEDRIVGMLLTHGHEDHIGGLPYILPQLATDFPIYGSKLTVGFAANKLKEFGIKATLHHLPEGTLKLGQFTIENIHMTHSVPDARHFAVNTPAGTIYHGSDFKFDLNPIDGVLPDFQKIARVTQNGVLALLSDSLNSEVQSFSKSESALVNTFDREFHDVNGKIIFTVMSSNIHRIQTIVDLAAEHDRKVIFVGRSIEQNTQIAVRLGYLKLPKIVVDKQQLKHLKSHQVCLIIAGSQGQVGSSLTRAAEGEHYLVKITPQDKVIFASEPIPGNEQNVYATIDTISKNGADVTYSDIVDDVHASGHSSKIEQQLLIAFTKPRHLIPIGGTYHHMIEYRKIARKLGYPDRNIHLLDNGQILSFAGDQAKVDRTVSLQNVMVDGLGVGDVGHVVLRDRQQMAADGIIAIVVPIDQQTGQVSGQIDIISRGFVYMKQSKQLINQIKAEASSRLKPHQQVVTDWQSVRKKIESAVEKLVFKETQRRPLILTVVIEV